MARISSDQYRHLRERQEEIFPELYEREEPVEVTQEKVPIVIVQKVSEHPFAGMSKLSRFGLALVLVVLMGVIVLGSAVVAGLGVVFLWELAAR